MTILVTGATGFVGSAIVRRLLAGGIDGPVRVLIRAGSDCSNIEGLPLDIVVGDLRDRQSLVRAIKGCGVVFHAAADYRLWVPDPETMYAINVQGTEHLMQAALEEGVRKIVYTSSVATIKPANDGSPADEGSLATLEDMVGHYKRSKFLAECTVLNMVRDQRLPAVVVNPSTPVGPRDNHMTPTGKMILRAASGCMPAYVDTGLNFVHVDDVAAGHLLAFERGDIGERYILGAENMTLRQMLALLAQVAPIKAPRVRLPINLIVPFAYIAEAWARATGGNEPLLTVDGVRLARKPMYFSSQKAIAELEYRPRPVLEAFKDAVEWFRAGGYIR